jgi:hypothetical protein
MRKKPKIHEADGEYEIKFWKDWLEADLLKRRKMVEKLSILRDIEDIKKIKMPSKMRKHMVASNLNGFFEDLESAVYTKVRLDEKKKAKSK